MSAVFGGLPAESVERATREEVLVSAEVRTEWLALADKLGKKLSADRVLALKARLLALLATAEAVRVITPVKLCRDPADDAYLSLARAGRADVLLTGDDDLLSLTTASLRSTGLPHLAIVSPRSFLKLSKSHPKT